ncbi:MAG: histidine--tRNA ligase, partial [Rhodoferax sp.]|nr:histidine--tRNA ligase [Rhodoferax sp.]
VERVLELVKEQGTAVPLPVPDVYAVVPDAAAMPVALRTLQQLRDAGLKVQMHAGTADGLGSFKSQFKKADASGARYALVFGADELARGEVTVKSLRDAQPAGAAAAGAQRAESLADVASWAHGLQTLQSLA